ncbi:MAG: extracellular solute-binding protein, partial [Lawsonibacter sp.]|nr:extracellular solute-binding protein [Lawsonibacter sp.]
VGELSFIIHGDISALYCWKYDKGDVSLQNTKPSERQPDAYLLPNAQAQGISEVFEQNGQMYGLDENDCHLFRLDGDHWESICKINWNSVAQAAGVEQIDFSNASIKPHDFVKTDHFLYCLLPHSGSWPLLVSINLETQVCTVLKVPTIKQIQSLQGDDLLVVKNLQLERYHAEDRTFSKIVTVDGPLVYDQDQGVLYYEQNGALYQSTDFATSSAVCTPVMDKITTLVSLPEHKLAVYGSGGISIVNTQLHDKTKLRIEDYGWDDCERFQLANPDVTIEFVENTTESDEEELITNADQIDIITSASDVARYARKGYIAALSSSEKLKTKAASYYAPIQNVLRYNQTLYAMPCDVGIVMYHAYEDEWAEAGYPDFPKDLDNYFSQIEQFATTDVCAPGLTSLEEILNYLTRQYAIQYTTDSAPAQFDSPIYHSILKHVKALADQGIMGSVLYFSPFGVMSLGPFRLWDISGDQMIPFKFPALEPNQQPMLPLQIYSYVVNSKSSNIHTAIRYLEFMTTYADLSMQYSLSPQAPTMVQDVTADQKNVITFTMDHVRKDSSGMDAAAQQAALALLQQKLDFLNDREPEISDIGLRYYQENADYIRIDNYNFSDFARVPCCEDTDPLFTTFLYGTMSESELIALLNERAVAEYDGSH